MKKVTKSLLMILTLVFTLFTISSCSKKIEYVYEEKGIALTANIEDIPYQEYVLNTTGTTHRKLSKNVIAYDRFYFGNETRHIVYLSDNVELGVIYRHTNTDKSSFVREKPEILCPINNNDGINEFMVELRNELGFDVAIFAKKQEDYSIKVKVDYDKLGEETPFIGSAIASFEGNNNVYYVKKEFNQDGDLAREGNYHIIEYNSITNSLDKSHEFMNIFTDEEETTYAYVKKALVNTIDNKYKINIRKADEYNLEDIMDSEGNVYIDGDFNEWVVVNIPEDKNFNVSYNREGFAPYMLSLKYATRNNNYTKEIDCYKKWDESYGLIYSKKICIRRGTKYHFTEKKTLYLEIDGIEYKSMDVIPDLSLIKKASIYYYECGNKVYPYARIYFYGLDICRIVKMNSADGSQEIVIPNDIDIKYVEISAQNVSSSFKVGDKLC